MPGSPVARYLYPMRNASFEDFQKLDLRVGMITEAEAFPETRHPAYKLTIDLGPLGTRRSSAQITERYSCKDLIGRQVIVILNFPPGKIAGFNSEVLVLGAATGPHDVILLKPEKELPNGSVVR